MTYVCHREHSRYLDFFFNFDYVFIVMNIIVSMVSTKILRLPFYTGTNTHSDTNSEEPLFSDTITSNPATMPSATIPPNLTKC